MNKTKFLVVFYSRTGTTKKVAEVIVETLKCDVEEVFDTKKRTGVLGYLRSGMDAIRKKLTVIRETQKNPASYDIVVIGTSVWVDTLSAPIRTYITQFKDNFNKIALFCTGGSGEGDKVFEEMENLSNKSTLDSLALKREEVLEEEYLPKIEEFLEKISS